ncbi:MAG: 50S ribosomal protein L1 [Anaerolineae bacterium]|nr:50S ribosomal protein L1 [Anaerolineae bacterium]
MPRRGKKYREARERVDPNRDYTPEEGVRLLKEIAYAKFDETVEVHMRMGVDPRHADQQLRAVVSLPAGTGKTARILVFAEGEAQQIAEKSGADYVGSDDLTNKIQEGWLEFDVVLAVPQVMGKVGRLGKILGPRGLMPSPKAGTIVKAENLPETIEEIRKGRVEFRVDRTGNLHIPFGRTSFTEEQLLINLASVMETVLKVKPPAQKGIYIRRMVLTSTMGPGIKLDVTAAMGLPEIL